MKKNKKKKSKNTDIVINERITIDEKISYNSLVFDNIDFYTRNMVLTAGSLDQQINLVRNDLDSMSEMGETESLRLQMAMDRLQKMMVILSNLVKKIADTSESILENLK